MIYTTIACISVKFSEIPFLCIKYISWSGRVNQFYILIEEKKLILKYLRTTIPFKAFINFNYLALALGYCTYRVSSFSFKYLLNYLGYWCLSRSWSLGTGPIKRLNDHLLSIGSTSDFIKINRWKTFLETCPLSIQGSTQQVFSACGFLNQNFNYSPELEELLLKIHCYRVALYCLRLTFYKSCSSFLKSYSFFYFFFLGSLHHCNQVAQVPALDFVKIIF